MPKAKLDGQAGVDPADDRAAEDAIEEAAHEDSDFIATAATVGVVAVGAAIFEAALLPGLILGVAAMLAPKCLPRLGTALNPLFKSTVRGAYKLGEKTREMVAEMQEQVHDIVAEVDSEGEVKSPEPKRAARAVAVSNA
jgi:hypothetical protein